MFSNIFFTLVLVSVAFAADKVKASLYYEVFCGGCKKFITHELADFHNKEDLMAITDLELVPYGNAKVLTRDPPTFWCQNGQEECYGNEVELCAQKYNPNKWWDFILCEETVADFGDEAVKQCAAKAGINAEEILQCAKGPEGPLLHLEASERTPADHKWVPWALVNGELVEEIEDFQDAVCNAYQGEKPASCLKTTTEEAPKVVVAVYHESLCVACSQTICEFLDPYARNPEFMKIVKFDIVSYGNAKTLTRDPPTFKCQHGDDECYGNFVQLCAIEHNPDNYWDFLVAIDYDGEYSDYAVQQAAKKGGVDADEILKCAKGTEGPLLHLKAGDRTPKHDFVPWVTVDGKYLKWVLVPCDLTKEVCAAYKGVKPDFCKPYEK